MAKIKLDNHSKILIVAIAVLVLSFVGYLIYKGIKSKESYPFNVLKDTIGFASGNNIIENLDQAFAFIGGLCVDTKYPLLVSDCVCSMYNNKDKLVLYCNYLYNFHTGQINKDTFNKVVNNLGDNFDKFNDYLDSCKAQCAVDGNKRKTYTLFNFDQLLGFMTGSIIKESEGMMYPCPELLRYLRYFIYDNAIEKILIYVNIDLKVKSGEITGEQGMMFLKSQKVDVEALQNSLKTYCRNYCENTIC